MLDSVGLWLHLWAAERRADRRAATTSGQTHPPLSDRWGCNSPEGIRADTQHLERDTVIFKVRENVVLNITKENQVKHLRNTTRLNHSPIEICAIGMTHMNNLEHPKNE